MYLPLMGLMVLASLTACGGSKSQNPVSGEEVGKVSDETYNASEEKPLKYTAKAGDTLRKIAGRPEIYGDPNMWPILQEANADSLGQSMSVNKGVQLKIPRDYSTEQVEMAHEKARQVSAADKMASKPAKKAEAVPTEAPSAKPVNTPVPPQPVPEAKKGGALLTVLFVLLLILAALAVVLFYFMKKEKKDENQD